MRKTKGFTLLEILIALTIMILLVAAGMEYISLQSSQIENKAEQLKGDLELIEESIRLYKSIKGTLPSSTCSPVYVNRVCLPDLIPDFLKYEPEVSRIFPEADSDYYIFSSSSYIGFKLNNPGEISWKVIKKVNDYYSSGRFVVSDSGYGRTSDYTNPLPDTPPSTVYITFWLGL